MLDLKALLADERGHLAVLSEERINPALCKVLKVLGYNKQYTRGKGAYLFDEAGNRYVDCFSGFGTFACGRNHPAIREALKQTMDLDLPNLVAMGVASLSGLLARELINLAPGDLEMVFFTNSGTEGVETAIKYARAATGKSRIVHCKRSFHGLSLGSLSVNGNEEFKEGFGQMLEPVSACRSTISRRWSANCLGATSPDSSSSRFRGRAFLSPARIISPRRPRCAASTKRSSSRTKCKRGSAERARCLPASTGVSSPTS